MPTDQRADAPAGSTTSSAPPGASGKTRRERWFVLLYRPGPNWIVGKPLIEQRIGAHLDYMRELCARGPVASAGGFLDADSGGMVLMRAPDLAAAQAVIDGDPAIRDGVFTGVARPYHPMFGAVSQAAS